MAKRSTSSLPLYPLPQLGTKRTPGWPTFGTTVARYHLGLNRLHLLPHSRHVVDVAGEVNPETMRRRYDTVLLGVPRQNTKTWTLEAQMLAASRRPVEWEIDDRNELVAIGPTPRRTCLYLAQDRQMARERLVVDLADAKLDRNPVFRGRYHVRRSNGSERITWRDTGGRVMVAASNDTAGHGLTTDDAFLDEAFAHKDLTIVNAIQPTMITKPDPQLWIVSTAGEGDDALLLHYEEIAAVAVNDPDTTVAVFIWRAGPDDDRTDPAVWRSVMPALGRTITEQRVRALQVTTPPAEFDRAYLNRRPTVQLLAAIDPAAFADCTNPTGQPLDPAGPIVLAVDVNPARTHANLAVAFAHPWGVGVIVDRRPGVTWLVDAVLGLVHRHGVTVQDVWGDRRAGVGGVLDQLTGRGVPVHELSAGDVASACGDMYDLTRARMLCHDGQVDLVDAVAGSRARPLGEAWAYSKLESTADVAPLNAATMAVAGYRHHFPVGAPTGGIR